MTNYNERLDEILTTLVVTVHHAINDHNDDTDLRDSAYSAAQEAITSLIKELVAEAKPLYYASPDKSEYQDGFNTCIRLYEQNLLKALEKVK